MAMEDQIRDPSQEQIDEEIASRLNLVKLTRDQRDAARSMTEKEARYLVGNYYKMQENRKRSQNQLTAMEKAGEPHAIIRWSNENSKMMETQLRTVLGVFAEDRVVGRWSQSIVGIGPVISAGLVAYIPFNETPGVSNLWSYAGLNPQAVWEKGTKRPWNAALKTLCWKVGESFVHTCNHDDSSYGRFYVQWKQAEETRNESGHNAAAAAKILLTKNFGKETAAKACYGAGKLPPAHVHARATRKVVKLFLSHWYTVLYESTNGHPMEVMPYAIDHLGHKDFIPAPKWPMD